MKIPLLTQAVEIGLQLAEDNSRDNSVLHVTDLSVTLPNEGCPRQLWLKLKGADKKQLSAGMMLMFWHGKRIHVDLVDLLRAGLPAEWEIVGVEVPMEFDEIHGTADVVLKNTLTHEIIVADFKTMRGRGFYFLNDEPKPAHKLQVQGYIYGLYQTQQFMPDGGLVLYVDREGQNSFQQFPVARDDNAVKEAIIEAKLIRDMPKAPDILNPVAKQTKATKTKGIPITVAMPWMCDYCLSPETRVLTGDLVWRELRYIRKGDTLIGFDKNPLTAIGEKWRRWRPTIVDSISRVVRPCYRIHLKNGDTFMASSEHKWLVNYSPNKAGGGHVWVETQKLYSDLYGGRPNARIPKLLKVMDMWEPSMLREAGYLAAAFDGEGTFRLYRGEGRSHTCDISFAQKDNPMAQCVREALDVFEFSWGEDERQIDDVRRIRIRGLLSDRLRFLGQIRPARFLDKLDLTLLGKMTVREKVDIVKMEYIGTQEVVAMATSTGTFVANGYASHNCDYCDISCTGALPYSFRNMGVVGHLDSGEFKPTQELTKAITDAIIDQTVIPF